MKFLATIRLVGNKSFGISIPVEVVRKLKLKIGQIEEFQILIDKRK